MEGDSVTLHTNLSEILNDDTILWLFGPKESLISQITRKGDLNSIYFTDDEKFRHRLQVDQNTGSLTVRNIRIRHSGQYKLSISREMITIKIFHVTVFGVVNETDEVKSESVMEGESVTLNADVEVQRDDLIVWRFGDRGILLAKIDVETKETSLNDDDERFRDRLKIDHQTGTLTIKNTRTEHSGLYELQIRGRESSQRFLLSVTAVSDPGLSPGAIAGITVAVLLVLVVVVIYHLYMISKLKNQVAKEKSGAQGNALLETGVKIKTDDLILWTFGLENHLVATVDSSSFNIDESFGARFIDGDRLKLDRKTGSLTIKNIEPKDYGHYKLQIVNKKQTKFKRFNVFDPAEEISVAEGNDVPLKVVGVKIKPGDVILWTFGAENCLVARADSETIVYNNKRFGDRVELNPQTGSLTIKDIKKKDSGHYKLQIFNAEQAKFKRFIVTVAGKSAYAKTASVKEERTYKPSHGQNPLMETHVNE
ncbi:uncharacterized protein LOC120475660 isoform X2 [Pimephales promelas]|nr:uncharacterized protein LOC120475660 isoform X2 [Pimephales promelas]